MMIHKKQYSVSAISVKLSLAMAVFLPLSAVAGNPVVQCSRAIQFDRLVRCDVDGHITVTAGGLLKTDGCLHPLGTPKQALCDLEMSLPQTQTVQVSMTRTHVTLTGAGNMILDQFNIHTENGGSVYTFMPSDLTRAHTPIGIGGRLNLSGNQTSGTYTGSIGISVTFP